MKNEFYIIEVKITDHEGDSYQYVTGIEVNSNGWIIVNTSNDPLDGIRFNIWGLNNDQETKLREQYINIVKSYFPKKNYEISYKLVTVTL